MDEKHLSISKHLWAITIPKCDLKDFFFLGFFELSNRLIVSIENHADSTTHLHIFVDLKKKANFFEIKAIVRDGFSSIGDERTDVGNIQVVKSATQWILYCLKSDPNPKILNINQLKLSYSQELSEWLKQSITREFQFTDEFVIKHSNQYSFLKSLHAESKRNVNRVEALSPIFGPFEKDMLIWQHEIITWYNDFLSSTNKEQNKHLWLSGPPLSGKTSFIMHLLERSLLNMDQCFIICDDQNYHFGHLIPGYHLISLNDGFEPADYKIGLIQRALSGELFNQNIKYEKTRMITLTIPFIFISNKLPESNNDITTFLSKLKVIDLNKF